MSGSDSFYTVKITSGGDRDLENLTESIQGEIEEELGELCENPDSGKALSNQPNNVRAYEFKKLSTSSEYRAGYVKDDENELCLVFAVGPRENFYEHMMRKLPSAFDSLDKES